MSKTFESRLWFVLHVVGDSNIMWFHGGMSKRVESHVYQVKKVTAMQEGRSMRSHSNTSEPMGTDASSQVRLHSGMSKRVKSHVYQVTNDTAMQDNSSSLSQTSGHMGKDATPTVRLWCCLHI